MGYVYSGVSELVKGETPVAGSGECVDLIKHYVPGLIGVSTQAWRAGASVMEAGNALRRGTAIATFGNNGHFPGGHSGQHAALLLSVMSVSEC